MYYSLGQRLLMLDKDKRPSLFLNVNDEEKSLKTLTPRQFLHKTNKVLKMVKAHLHFFILNKIKFLNLYVGQCNQMGWNFAIWVTFGRLSADFRQLLPTLDNFGWLWATLSNFGWLWTTLGNFGQLWLTLGNFGWLRAALGDFGRLLGYFLLNHFSPKLTFLATLSKNLAK